MEQFPDDADGAVLKRLKARGIDLSLPLVIEFDAYAPDGEAANNILSELESLGWSAEIDFDPGEPDEDGKIDPEDLEFGPSWTVTLKHTMVPVYSTLISMQRIIDDVAKKHGGRADGWGVLT